MRVGHQNRILTQQLEQAKISEAKDMPTVQVLDPAVPADHRSKPSFKVNISLAGFTSLFFGVLLAFWMEYKERWKRLPICPSPKAKVETRTGTLTMA